MSVWQDINIKVFDPQIRVGAGMVSDDLASCIIASSIMPGPILANSASYAS